MLSPKQRDKWIEGIDDKFLEHIDHHWPFWARPNQLAPEGDWRCWLVLAGRGFGKTRCGAEFIRDQAERDQCFRIALIGRTAADVRDVMIEGPSGILAVSHPWFRPVYEPSKRQLSWPNGVIAKCYSAEKPDQLRGPNHDLIWFDELAAFERMETYDQAMFGLRLGDNPRYIVTTTPRPIGVIRTLAKAKSTVVTRGSTFDNSDNLADAFLDELMSRYRNTTQGRQELYAELLDEAPGALWKRADIEGSRVDKHPDLVRIVVSVDPAITSKEGSDETGIVVVGVDKESHFYILADYSGRYTPAQWAKKAIKAYEKHSADRIVAEVNQGGDMVKTIIKQHNERIPFEAVWASRGKQTRAEPVAARFEQGMCHMVGMHRALEDQLTNWVPGMGKSPDRLDALVHGVTCLDTKKGMEITIDPGVNNTQRKWV